MDAQHGFSPRPVIWAIALLVVGYTVLLLVKPSALGTGGHGGHGDAEHASAEHVATPTDDHGPDHTTDADHADTGHAEADHADASHAVGAKPDTWAVTPFIVLLGAIATFPLLRFTAHWWEENLHRFYFAAACALLTLGYYFFVYPNGGFAKVQNVLDHAIMGEYVPFIVLLFSLYTISGGIRIEGDLVATSWTNCLFLITGGALASFIGTTGAAMLLIRPLLDTNDERKHVQHTVVFFIIVVCNCGGCLLPIGDPPLFLGYLKGVAFLWTLTNLWLPWLVTNALLIALYFVVDRYFYFPKEKKSDLLKDVKTSRPLNVKGLWPNALLLIGVILCVALLDSSKPVPGTEWHPWPLLREVLQLALVGFSLASGNPSIRLANRFNFHAIIEVGALFIGIFICMQPAIEILNVEGAKLGLETPMQMFWYTGSLSAVLDNAPTYVVFYETAAADPRFAHSPFHEIVGTGGNPEAIVILQAISLGAVFMGAMTYIGNGPNFMVRAIAEQSGIRMPSFFGYIFRYTVPYVVPILLLVTWWFFT